MGKLLYKLWGFDNIGSKLRTIAKVISGLWIGISLIYAILVLFLTIVTGFGGALLIVLICLPILLFIVHIPLWKLYAFGDIYDSLCNSKKQQVDTTNQAESSTGEKTCAIN